MACSGETDWRASRGSIRERNQYLYNNTLFSDVEFSVKNSEDATVTIPAHKYVLAIGSAVFEAMFFGDLAETSRTIALPDCTDEGLLEMLRYLYYDEIELSLGNVIEVLYLAKKYIIPTLTKRCIPFLSKIEPEDVLSVLEEIAKLNDDELTNVCWKIVDTETQQAVTSEAFLNVTQETLCDMLARDSLEITEVELFQVVYRWAENKVTQAGLEKGGGSVREVIGEKLLHLVRFPCMTLGELTEIVLPTEILNMREVTEMVRHQIYFTENELMPTMYNFKPRKGLPRISGILPRGVLPTEILNVREVTESVGHQLYFTENELMPAMFNVKPRKGLPRIGGILSRGGLYCCASSLRNVTSFDKVPPYDDGVKSVKCSITFKTDKLIFLEGAELHMGPDTKCTIEVLIYKDQHLVLRQQEKFHYAKNSSPKEVIMFRNPFLVFPDTELTMMANIEGDIYYGSDNGNQSIKCESNVTFHFTKWSSKNGDNVCNVPFPNIFFYHYRK